MKRNDRVRSALLLLAVGAALWAFVPRTIVIVPKWEVRVEDSAGQPYPDIEVTQHWAHYSVSLVSQYEEGRTNREGVVTFGERTVVLSGIDRIRGALRAINLVGIHASFGTDSSVSVAEPASNGMTVAVLRERAARKDGGLVSKVSLLGTVDEFPALPANKAQPSPPQTPPRDGSKTMK